MKGLINSFKGDNVCQFFQVSEYPCELSDNVLRSDFLVNSLNSNNME